MSSTFTDFAGERRFEAGDPPPPTVPDWFEERAYLAAHPDVAAAVAEGELKSGYAHYAELGWQENRPLFVAGSEPCGRLLMAEPASPLTSAAPEVRSNVDAMLVSASGGIFVVGWVDDSTTPIEFVRLRGPDWTYVFDAASLLRIRRTDVEASFGSGNPHSYGFVAFAFADARLANAGPCDVSIGTREASVTHQLIPRRVDDVELRNVALGYLSKAEFLGNRQLEAIRGMDRSLGRELVKHNLHITRGIVAGACVQRIGHRARPPLGSIIVCLYGKPEYLFLQNALFSGGSGFSDYELIYVSNSPEMAERLLKEAHAAYHVYGIPQTVVLLPGNAGFGAANNVAVQYARSGNRIIILNPDVFPRDQDWAQKHTQVIGNLPSAQTRLFGVPLYYDDGSLMHGGMYFEFDTGVSVDANRVTQSEMLRVEHYGKGAPVWASQFVKPRPIQAVTGAFISVKRAWFEALGGFTENYIFGHYEDADLCLKSIQGGTAPWIHDIRMWHLEGKGSTRLPVHEGGSLVNRWLFTRTWNDTIRNGLEGLVPSSPMMKMAEVVAEDVVPPEEAVAESVVPPAEAVSENVVPPAEAVIAAATPVANDVPPPEPARMKPARTRSSEKTSA
jgi:GT2 family glycosyltransferase